MGSRMGIAPIPPPEPSRRSAGVASGLGRALLGLVLTVLRCLLMALFVVLILLGRLVLWFPRLLFWRGLLTLRRARSMIQRLVSGASR